MSRLTDFNSYPSGQKKSELFKCCGSSKWSEQLASGFPFSSLEEIKRASDTIWFALEESDWKEAFQHHPKIGDVDSLKKKFASTAGWASGEQSGVQSATDQVLSDLKKGNDVYETRFGYIFIVCATGKSAAEMLELLTERLSNSPEEEIRIAMNEQNKITHLRLEKLFA